MRTLPNYLRVVAFINRRIPLLFFSFLVSSTIFSQTVTHTFNYSYLITKGCNIFATATNVNGYNHLTSVGFPYWSTGKAAVALDCAIGSTLNTSTTTRYSIAYPFKEYYSYALNAYAEGFAPAGNLQPWLGFLVSNSTDGTNSSLVCGGPGSVSNADINTYANKTYGTSWAWLSSPISFVASQNYSYLILSSYATEGPSQDSVFVQQLTISETPPFSINPQKPVVICGEQTAIAFTAINNSNLTGITGYTWNIGANSNWLYNGIPAPATISTTTNTLTLNYYGGGNATPSSPTVTVSFGGTTFTTGAATPSVGAPPTLSISGPAGICTTATYSIPGLPSNLSVTWSLASGAGSTLVLTPNSNNTLTITNNNYYTETTTLTATISGPCYAPLTKQISAGSPTLSFSGLINQGLCYGDETITNQALYTTSEPNFIYSYCPAIITMVPYDLQCTLASGSPGEFSFSPGSKYGNAILNLTLAGSPVSVNVFEYQGGGCPTQTIWFMARSDSHVPTSSYIASPVPASGLITIAPISESGPTAANQSPGNSKNRMIRQIRVFDITGRLRQTFNFGTSVTQAQIDVSKLESGVYFMEIFNGEIRETKKIFVRH